MILFWILFQMDLFSSLYQFTPKLIQLSSQPPCIRPCSNKSPYCTPSRGACRFSHSRSTSWSKYHSTLQNPPCEAEVDNRWLIVLDASDLSGPEVMILSVTNCLSLLYAITGFQSLKDSPDIICNPSVDSHLLFTRIGDLKHCHIMCDWIVINDKHS